MGVESQRNHMSADYKRRRRDMDADIIIIACYMAIHEINDEMKKYFLFLKSQSFSHSQSVYDQHTFGFILNVHFRTFLDLVYLISK